MPVQSGTLPSGTKFAIESVKNGTKQDLKMRLEVPKKYGWGAVGIGTGMPGSTIFLTYPSSNGNETTLSVRKGVAQVEPLAFHKQPCHIEGTSETTNSSINTAFTCPGMGDDKALKNNPTSDWIWSAGPGLTVDSNSVEATIQMHNSRGFFQVDMVKAAQSSGNGGGGGVPEIPGGGGGGIIGGETTSPSQPLILAHAYLLAGSFLILFPLGVFLLRLRSVRLHWITQTLAFILSVIGFIIAIAMCATTDQFSKFNEPHQILGIVAACLLFPQIAMGFANHWTFRSTSKGTIMRFPHLYLGRIVIVLGMVNGILGFMLYDSNKGAIGYGIASGIVILSLIGVMVWGFFKSSQGIEDTGDSDEPNKVTDSPE